MSLGQFGSSLVSCVFSSFSLCLPCWTCEDRAAALGPAGVAAVGRAGAAAVGPAGVAGELFELISPSNLRAVWLRKEFVTDYFQNGLLINAAYYFTLYAFYTPPTNRLIMQKPNFLSWRMFAPGRFCSK